MSLSQAGQNAISQKLSQTMGMTVRELAETIQVDLPALLAERRAHYVPNMDAAGLGYGPRHRDYKRYLSSWNARSRTTRSGVATATPTSPQSGVTATSSSQSISAQAHSGSANEVKSASPTHTSGNDVAMPGSKLSIQAKGFKEPGPMTSVHCDSLGSISKPSKLNQRNEIIRDAGGLGYGRRHQDHCWYIMPKRPDDCRPLNTTLQLNSW